MPSNETIKTICLVVIVLVVIGFILFNLNNVKNTKSYIAPKTGQFQVNRPKYNPADPSTMQREGYMFGTPLPSSKQVLKSENANGGFLTATSMPYLGGLSGAMEMGLSVPGRNSVATMSGNGAGNPGAKAVWATVI